MHAHYFDRCEIDLKKINHFFFFIISIQSHEKKSFILQLIKLKRKRALEYVEKDEIDMCCSFQMHFLSSIFDAVIYLERSLCKVWKNDKKIFSFKKYFV